MWNKEYEHFESGRCSAALAGGTKTLQEKCWLKTMQEIFSNFPQTARGRRVILSTVVCVLPSSGVKWNWTEVTQITLIPAFRRQNRCQVKKCVQKLHCMGWSVRKKAQSVNLSGNCEGQLFCLNHLSNLPATVTCRKMSYHDACDCGCKKIFC